MFRFINVVNVKNFNMTSILGEKPMFEVTIVSNTIYIDMRWNNGKHYNTSVKATESNLAAIERIQSAIYNPDVNITVALYNGELHTWSWNGYEHNTIESILQQLSLDGFVESGEDK